MGLFDFLKGQPAQDPEVAAAAARRQADILMSLRGNHVPIGTAERLKASATGAKPWMATLSPAELRIVKSHGLTPIASVSATCWLHYGWSWTEGHAEGWNTAIKRLKMEARAAGANAVLDVKMRTIPLAVEESMDFTLVGTAVKLEGLGASGDPVIATVPALEFVKLIEADVVPTGIAVGAHYQWLTDWRGSAAGSAFYNNEAWQLSQLWEQVRRQAHGQLKQAASSQGNGVLAHVNFSQMFERERNEMKEYLARHIVIATTVDARRGTPFPHDIKMVVDMQDKKTPLTGTPSHHQSYATNQEEGGI
jgi:hypothetical protein